MTKNDDKKKINIFAQDQIIKNSQYLEESYIPDLREIYHRDDEIRDMGISLSPIFSNGKPSDMFISGFFGSGKTMLVKAVMRELYQEAEKKDIQVTSLMTNCKHTPTHMSIMKKITRDFEHNIGSDHEKLGNAASEYFHRFEVLANNYIGTIFVILDEMNFIKDPDILYYFNRLDSGNVCVIGIANELRFLKKLSPETKSSLSADLKITLASYDAHQLYDILRARAEKSLICKSYSDPDQSVLKLCAAIAAREYGDARKAIELLFVGARIATRANRKIITDNDIYEAEKEICEISRAKIVRSLSPKLKSSLYALIETYQDKEDTATIKKAYQKYLQYEKKIDGKPVSYSKFHEFIDHFEGIGFISSTVIPTGRGRTTIFWLEDNISDMLEVLRENYYMTSFWK